MIRDLSLPPSSIRELLAQLARFFHEHGLEAYATGGFLRDALLGLAVHDIDVSVRGDPLSLGTLLAAATEGHYFPLDEENHIARVLVPARELNIDLRLLDGALEEDLRRRDYTIDALGAPLDQLTSGRIEVTDPTAGLEDLDAGIVRTTGEQALLDDPLRLLRGPRIATQLGFVVETQTAELIRRYASLVQQAAPERQRDELLRIFSTPFAGRGVRLLEELGLLAYVLPEMEVTRGAEQPKEHHWDVLGHSLAAVEKLDALLAEQPPAPPPDSDLWQELWTQLAWWTDAREYFCSEVVMGTTRAALLKFCGLLHDIGKPETRTIDETGRMRFFGHSGAGAEIAARLMQRLRFSSREVSLVRAMIEAHLRPVQMAQQGPPSRRAIYRFFRDTGDAGIDTLFLSLADHLATVGPRLNMDGFQQHVAVVSYILAKRFEDPSVVMPPKLLRGDELMAALGIAPGPLVGELLEVVREAQAAGEVTTQQQALDLARQRLAAAGAVSAE